MGSPAPRRGTPRASLTCAFAIVLVIATCAGIVNYHALRSHLSRKAFYRKHFEEIHVAVVIPVISVEGLDPRMLERLDTQNPADNRYEFTVVYAIDPDITPAAVLRRHQAASAAPVQFVVTPPGHPRRHLGVLHASAFEYLRTVRVSHILWLSQTHTPLEAGFVAKMLDGLLDDAKFGAAACLTLEATPTPPYEVDKPGAAYRVVDKGYRLRDGELDGEERFFFARRLAGAPFVPERLRGRDNIVAGTSHCLLLEAAAALRLPLRIDSGTTVARLTPAEELEVLRYRTHALAAALLSVTPAMIDDARTNLRAAVRLGFETEKQAIQFWEDRTQRDFDESDSFAPALVTFERQRTGGGEAPEEEAGSSLASRVEVLVRSIEECMVRYVLGGSAASDALAWEIALTMRRKTHLTVALDVPVVVTPLPSSLHPDSAAGDPQGMVVGSTAAAVESTSVPIIGRILNDYSDVITSAFYATDDDDGACTVAVDTACCTADSGADCCSNTLEFARLSEEIQGKYRVRTRFASAGSGPADSSCFCSGGMALSVAQQDIMRRTLTTTDYYYADAPMEDLVVRICVGDPDTCWDRLPSSRRPQYTIGRPAADFSRVPLRWRQAASQINELWITGPFARDLLIESGVDRRKLVVMQPSVDLDVMNPAVRAIVTLPLPVTDRRSRFCNMDAPNTPLKREGAGGNGTGDGSAKRYVFVTVFPWDLRFGWDVLLDAYARFFTPTEDVSLYVLVTDTPNTTRVIDDVTQHLHSRNVELADVPHFCLLFGDFTQEFMADMIHTADSFAFPMRTAGWHAPLMSAMALGKPVLVTNYGGAWDMTRRDAAFLVEAEAIEELPSDYVGGWDLGKRWATPSVPDTGATMRYMHDHRTHAAEVGERGMALALRLSKQNVSKMVRRRAKEIRNWLRKVKAGEKGSKS
jgi:glycosyltransferase involved in cell wall biosynthesis